MGTQLIKLTKEEQDKQSKIEDETAQFLIIYNIMTKKKNIQNSLFKLLLDQ